MRGVALALGGGGVRGYAHLGVLAVLEEAGVPIRGLAGSSAGALAAAAWAFGHKDPWRVHEAIFDREVAELSRAGSLRALARLFIAFRRPAVVDTDRIEEGLKALFGEARLEESPIPLALQAADLLTGEAVVLREGPVWKAVLASMAIPGLFPRWPSWGGSSWTGTWRRRCRCGRPRPSSPRWWPWTSPTLRPRNRPGRPSGRPPGGRGEPEAAQSPGPQGGGRGHRPGPPFPIDTFDHERLEFVYELGKHRAKERLPEVLALARTRLRDLLPRR